MTVFDLTAAIVQFEKGDAAPLKEWYEHGAGAAKIRWGTKGAHGRCVKIANDHMTTEQAHGFCAEREHAATGHWPGERSGKHTAGGDYAGLGENPSGSLRVEAEGETLADKPNVDSENECPPGHVMDDAGECHPAEGGGGMSTGDTWEGVLVVEGAPTGDKREFAPESLTWPDPSEVVIPLRWNKQESHGGETRTVAVNVGRITDIWRDGTRVMGRGVFDLNGEDGAEARRRVAEGFLAGVSIDADDIADADVELVWPEHGEETEGDDGLAILFGRPEKTIFNAGRIRGATLCDIPAFVEAYIKLTDGGEPRPVVGAAFARGAVSSHESATSDGDWESADHEARLPRTLAASTARGAYAFVDAAGGDDEVTRLDCRFLHHEIDEDGAVGAANVHACAVNLGIVQGAHGSDVTESERRGIYDHLARHVRDAGREVPPFIGDGDVGTLVASAAIRCPSREWFENPRLSQLMPVVVTDNLRVYGHAAQWGQCHLGQGDRCQPVPYEADHSYFLTGEVVCDDGSRVAVGQIFTHGPHANLRMNPARTVEHYENTAFVVADVAVGNDDHGIWVAGVVRPEVRTQFVNELRASGQVSPDWRRIGGALRMVGMLVVNVSGYQVPRPRARVLNGEVQALVAAGIPTVGHAEQVGAIVQRNALRSIADKLAARVGLNA